MGVKSRSPQKKAKVLFVCQACGYESPQYLGRCPLCNEWNTLSEATITSTPSGKGAQAKTTIPQSLNSIQLDDQMGRFHCGISELDRVLGGGWVPGAYLLIGGDPGVGKSTLLLQVAQHLADQDKVVMVVAGEESAQQIRLRSQRLNISGKGILIYPETDLTLLMEELKTSKPHVVIIDSIQSLYHPDIPGTPGTMSQVKECASQLMQLAKTLDITICLIGHVTKDGVVAGPKLLEHMVDTVLYLEGDKGENLRILRAVKNRFGNVNEIGVFEMTASGLNVVDNPSALFLSDKQRREQVPGSVILATLEGNRPLLVEIQALVGYTTYPSPRRVANGFDLGRLHQVIAVLERRLGLDLSKQDVYVNVVGGFKIQEPAGDLAVALALVSSLHDVPLKPHCVVAGEIGLTGEIRAVSQPDLRFAEAQRLGFTSVVLPKLQNPETKEPWVGVASIMDALPACLSPQKPTQPSQ